MARWTRFTIALFFIGIVLTSIGLLLYYRDATAASGAILLILGFGFLIVAFTVVGTRENYAPL